MLTGSNREAGSMGGVQAEAAVAAPQRVRTCPFSSMSTAVRAMTDRGEARLGQVTWRDRCARLGTLAYGLLAYGMFLGTILYAIGWVGNWFVPKSIDSGAAGSIGAAIAVNSALLVLFVVQHTVMARPRFKAWWVKIVPQAIERSTFVIAASLCLIATFWLWRPMPAIVWEVRNPAGWWALTLISIAGWVMVFASSFMVSHWDLFGLRQTWLRFRAEAYRPVGFRLVGLYRIVRHPLMVGFLIAFWATPVMTVGHLFFAVMTTGYIFFGTWVEERDLVAAHGEDYLAYRRRVGGFVPRM